TLANITNNPPVVILPGEAQSLYEHTSLAFSPVTPTAPVLATVLHQLANPIQIFDVDSNGGVETVSLVASVGTLALVDPSTGLPLAPNAISGVSFSGNGTAADPLLIRGPLGDLNQDALGNYLDPGINVALTYLVFGLNNPTDPSSYDFNGAATITIVANDLGNTPPPAKITTAILPIAVIAVNDPPANSVPSGVTTTMDFPAGSALGGAASSASNNSYVPAVNGPLAFQMVNSTSGGTIDFQLDGAATFAIAANATGADLAGQTLTIKVGNLTKTFEFVTAASGGPSGTNLAINVNSGDDAAALASAAAAAISGVTGFGSAVIVNGNQLTFNGASLRISTDGAVHDPAATLPAAGLIAPVANTWNLDIAPNITGADLAGEEITVNLGGTIKTFEFVTTASGGPSGANIGITVQSSDVATTLATLAAGAINT